MDEQQTIEKLAKQLVRVRRAMARNYTDTVVARHERLTARIDALPAGQQLAVLLTARDAD